MRQLFIFAVRVVSAGAAQANADVVVYRRQSQSGEQQSQDEYQCYQWAQ
jgi:hypothetical protein